MLNGKKMEPKFILFKAILCVARRGVSLLRSFNLINSILENNMESIDEQIVVKLHSTSIKIEFMVCDGP